MNPLEKAKAAEKAAAEQLRTALASLEAATTEQQDERQKAFEDAHEAAQAARSERERLERIEEAREAFPAPEQPAADEQRDASPEVRVKSNEPTYRQDGASHSFFRDIRSARAGDSAAIERLHRNRDEAVDAYRQKGRLAELRDVTTGAGADGFIPPIWMSSLYVDIPREGRPAAAIFPTMPLPDLGMTVTIPRLVTGPSVAAQDPEGQALSDTDIDSDTLTVPINTVGGIQDMTLQAWERTDPALDGLIAAELTDVYDNALDVYVLAGTGANHQHTGIRAVANINTVTFTDGAPTAAKLTPKLYDAIQQVRTGRKMRATHILMHPRRAAWLASQLSSTFPLFAQGGYVNQVGAQNLGAVFTIAGLPVVEDGNIGAGYGASTNEDEVYVVHAPSSLLMESALRYDVHDQPLGDQLKVRVRVFAYSAFASKRYPTSITKISGTGLVTPTF